MSFSTSSEGTVPGFALKKFESQNEVDEKKKKRQEEWEKVRKPDDPEEAPEQPVDNRSLYDKLQEQKVKKDEEFEEKVAFRNQVRRLDADETDFLDFCTEVQQEIKQERKLEEEAIISEMKDAKVIKLTDTKPEEKKQQRPVQQLQGKRSQTALLAGAVKRKGSDDSSSSKKLKTESTAGDKQTKSDQKTESKSASASDSNQTSTSSQLARVIGVRPRALAGLTEYADSSDSESSSSDSEPDFSLSGRNNVVLVARQQMQQQH